VAETEAVAILRSNSFDDLLARIDREKVKNMNSDLNKDRMAKIVAEIMSVYFFMRRVLGMPYREISIEEFDAVKQKLNEMARDEIKKFFGWLRAPIKHAAWKYYSSHGHFGAVRTPFGNWFGMQPLGQGLLDKDTPHSAYLYSTNSSYKNTIPPNIKRLAEDIFKARYTPDSGTEE